MQCQLTKHHSAAHRYRSEEKFFPKRPIHPQLDLGVKAGDEDVIKVPQDHVGNQMGDNKADQPGLEVKHHQDKNEEKDFLKNEPEIVELVILKGTQDGAVTGAVKGSQGR